MIDNLDRVRILAVSVAIFGLATVGGAWAGNFLHLLRTFVGEKHFNGHDEINGRLKMLAKFSDTTSLLLSGECEDQRPGAADGLQDR